MKCTYVHMAKNTNLSKRPSNLFQLLELFSYIILNLNYINEIKKNQIKFGNKKIFQIHICGYGQFCKSLT